MEKLIAQTRECIADVLDLLAQISGSSPHMRASLDEQIALLLEIQESLPEAPRSEVPS